MGFAQADVGSSLPRAAAESTSRDAEYGTSAGCNSVGEAAGKLASPCLISYSGVHIMCSFPRGLLWMWRQNARTPTSREKVARASGEIC